MHIYCTWQYIVVSLLYLLDSILVYLYCTWQYLVVYLLYIAVYWCISNLLYSILVYIYCTWRYILADQLYLKVYWCISTFLDGIFMHLYFIRQYIVVSLPYLTVYWCISTVLDSIVVHFYCTWVYWCISHVLKLGLVDLSFALQLIIPHCMHPLVNQYQPSDISRVSKHFVYSKQKTHIPYFHHPSLSEQPLRSLQLLLHNLAVAPSPRVEVCPVLVTNLQRESSAPANIRVNIVVFTAADFSTWSSVPI